MMQSNRARIAVLVASVAAVAVLSVVFLGGDEEPEPTTTVATETTIATDADGADGEEKSPRPKPEPEPEVPEVVLENSAPKGGPLELSVKAGEEVRFDVLSDVSTEVHVHGYELYFDVTAGKKQTISFKADLEGAYEIEAHLDPAGDVQIAELKVNPA